MREDLAIIHLDMDAFYASVEQRDQAELQGCPVIVGGSRERGVVCACSYETRPFGVRSGMAMARAVSLCPEAVVLPVRMGRYQEVSRHVFSIFQQYTDLVEPLSIDEAFLDVSACRRLHGSAETIANRIRRQVREELSLVISAGVAKNKFLAKLASAEAKPDGLKVLPMDEIDAFLLPLPIAKIWGIGTKTSSRLARLGIRTVADLRQFSSKDLQLWFGKNGEQLYQLVRGEDARQVEPENRLKSLGAEETFASDIMAPEALDRELVALAEKVARRVRNKELAGRTITLKVKYADFRTVTRSLTLPEAISGTRAVLRHCRHLLGKTEAGTEPIRLLGVYVSGLQGEGEIEPTLFEQLEPSRETAVDEALDQLNDRFGASGGRRASALGRGGSIQKPEEVGKGGE
ncbi:MAG: DNA polymerase IV [Desulfuromonas sp.]|nr:MAG: DNA polymerase IV [Desulfuromonas sp.]